MDDGWLPAARADEITTRPLGVIVADVPLVLLRPAADASPVAFADRCPHRLVPLSAATVIDGRLRCAYHGWEFAADGRCIGLPSAGPDATPPPRANLWAELRLRERDGVIMVHAADVATLSGDPVEPLTNEDPALARAWHPVALTDEVSTGGHDVRLLGREWTLRRVDEPTASEHRAARHQEHIERVGERVIDTALDAHPTPYGVRERWGVVWLAPEEPIVDLFDAPDVEDATFAGAWLPPVRTPVSAGVVADNFLDVAHFPFVHAGTFGAQADRVVQPYDVTAEPDGFSSLQVQWFDNPEDPGVAQGLRASRQRRRATYVYRAPFQLLLRLEELDAGAVKTILFFSQPEDDTSTRIYTKMLVHGIGGVAVPGPEIVAREVAFEVAVLEEDLALQRKMRYPDLPLRPRDELHVRADQLGIALRRHLRLFLDRASQS
jgi:phenylpropionate dioxygenase-like ring-hydroxylating dioxygenase large terminal subunit